MRGPPSVREHNARPGHSAPGTGSLGGPPIHGIKGIAWVWVSCCGVGRLEEVPEAAGEVAFEAAHGFESGLAFGAFAGDVVEGFGVAARAGERDPVDGGVELAVAAAVESVGGWFFRGERGPGGPRGAGGVWL